MSERNHVFISYSHEDKEWREQLVSQLAVLEEQKLLELCDDTHIGPGQPWHQVLEQFMSEACLSILMVSADFLRSDFILNSEIPLIFKRHRNDGMIIYPIIVRPCPWEEVPWLAELQVRPYDAVSVAERDPIGIEIVCKEMAIEILTMVRSRQMMTK